MRAVPVARTSVAPDPAYSAFAGHLVGAYGALNKVNFEGNFGQDLKFASLAVSELGAALMKPAPEEAVLVAREAHASAVKGVDLLGQWKASPDDLSLQYEAVAQHLDSVATTLSALALVDPAYEQVSSVARGFGPSLTSSLSSSR